MTFFMRPIDENTRLRSDHNTAGDVLNTFGPGQLIQCDSIWTADVDGVGNQKAGDRWGYVLRVNGSPTLGWMAIEHNGQPICTMVDAPPATAWPPYVILETPTGERQRYDRIP